MKPPAFAYERPTSVEAALATLARHGEDAKLLAGGQSLIPMLNLRLLAPKTIIDANRLAELDYIRVEDGTLRVGALARHNAVRHSSQVAEHCPLIAEPTASSPITRSATAARSAAISAMPIRPRSCPWSPCCWTRQWC